MGASTCLNSVIQTSSTTTPLRKSWAHLDCRLLCAETNACAVAQMIRGLCAHRTSEKCAASGRCPKRNFAAQAPKTKLPYSSHRKQPPATELQKQPSSTDRAGHAARARLRRCLNRKFAVQTFFWAFNSFLIAHVIWEYVASVHGCYGPSMLPTLHFEGDWILLSKLHARGRGVGVGDMVSFKHPVLPGRAIKRIVAMPGDIVLNETPGRGQGMLVQMPPNHCWLAGDNIDWTRDSRHFGPLPMSLIRGKVVARVWPASEMRWFRSALEDYDDSDIDD